MEILMRLANTLRQHRLKLGLTQKRMAILVGICTESIKKWECGELNITSPRRERVAKCYGIPVSKLQELCLEMEKITRIHLEARRNPKKKRSATVDEELPVSEISDALRRDSKILGSIEKLTFSPEPIVFYGLDGKPRKVCVK